MGGTMQQLNHGVSTGALFLLIGLIYERTHTRDFKDYGGIKTQMPIYAAIFLIVMLSSVGLPGTNGFIGEFLAMLGAFEAANAGAFGLNLGYAVVAGFGVVLAAVYLLYMFQQVFYGPIKNPSNLKLKDLKPWEIGLCTPLLILIFWGGLYPNTFLHPMEKAVGAVRLMALAPAGERPTWKNPQLEIDAAMNLVALTGRTADQVGGPVEGGAIVTPAKLRFEGQMVARATEPPVVLEEGAQEAH
jgi:NADH-quinone oxidoreductase subunit M